MVIHVEREMLMTLDELTRVVENKVNPKLAEHYGGALVTGWEAGVVYVRMTGACGQCPSAQETIENVVKEILMSELPEVKDVVLDTSVSQDLIDMAKKILNKEI
jgi:Fe-S cluster biogenesis protein NfuA